MQSLYIEKVRGALELSEYVAKLERMLLDHGLESLQLAKRRIELTKTNYFRCFMPAILGFLAGFGRETGLAKVWKMEMQKYGKITCNFVEKVLAKNI